MDRFIHSSSRSIARPKVQARKGFFAIPPGTRGQVAPFEVPLLSAIQSKDKIEGLPFEALTADLIREGTLTRGDMTIELPLEHFAAGQDASASLFRYRAAVLAFVTRKAKWSTGRANQ